MLISADKMTGYTLKATDDTFGDVYDFYFDDHHWTVRYLVADTGDWLPGQKVLISPESILSVDVDDEKVAVALTKLQIEASPSIDSDRPISRQHEIELARYYHWPPYWYGSAGAYGAISSIPGDEVATMPLTLPDQEQPGSDETGLHHDQDYNPNLRSASHVRSYTIDAADGELGHVEDFIIDTDTWAIRYVVVDTRNWLPGKHVLIPPGCIERIDWAEQQVTVRLKQEDIKQAPGYDEDTPITRDDERLLHEYYNINGYWT